MTRFTRAAQAERKLKWAKIWYGQLAKFHDRKGQEEWAFGSADVIAFSRSKLSAGVPAWKRLKMVEGLMTYRAEVQRRSVEDLIPVFAKLQEIAARERANEEGAESIEEVVGRINPAEPDVIQEYRRKLRLLGKKFSTERAYVGKLKAFMSARGLRSLADLQRIGGADVEAHLTDLAVDGNVAPSTQNQAFHALLFLFQHVLKRDIGRIEAIRASKGKQIPTVLSVSEVERVLAELRGVPLVIAKLLYGCGMRISEALRLRVKDIDFENRLIEIHSAKGGKSRIVPLPNELVEPLRRMVASRRVLHDQDVAEGIASVWLPHALAKKYPQAASQFRWQFVFASDRFSRDPHSGRMHRHHLHRDTFPGQLRRAVERTGIDKAVTSHTFRHSYATHLLQDGTDIRTIQELLGHQDVKTTMIYTHVVNRQDIRVTSPLDRLPVSGGNQEPDVERERKSQAVPRTDDAPPPRAERGDGSAARESSAPQPEKTAAERTAGEMVPAAAEIDSSGPFEPVPEIGGQKNFESGEGIGSPAKRSPRRSGFPRSSGLAATVLSVVSKACRSGTVRFGARPGAS